MKGTKVAARYAKSLLDLAIEQDKLEDTFNDMSRVDEVISNNRDMQLLLTSPIVKTDKKHAIIEAVFGSELRELSMAFIRLITSRRRESLLEGIAASFVRQYKVHKNILVAEITSAIPLDDKLRTQLKGLFKDIDFSALEMTEKVDPSIIGGFVVRVGDQQIDASLSQRIGELKQEFSKNPYIADF